jgi:hypothetical protein
MGERRRARPVHLLVAEVGLIPDLRQQAHGPCVLGWTDGAFEPSVLIWTWLTKTGGLDASRNQGLVLNILSLVFLFLDPHGGRQC